MSLPRRTASPGTRSRRVASTVARTPAVTAQSRAAPFHGRGHDAGGDFTQL